MTIYGYEIRNEYGLGAGELYKMADQDNPEAILEGVAMAGLVGFLRQLGDLAEFAADVFHNLHEEVTNAAIRSENLMLRVEQLEEDFPSIENNLCNDEYPDFASLEGISWHPNLETEMNIVTKEDMSSYVMEFYKGSRGPPQLFRLDKFDVSGQGACLKRYTDPSFFKVDLLNYGFTQENLRENRAPKSMIISNSSSIEIARSLRLPHIANLCRSETQMREENSDEIPITRVKLKDKQFKGSLLSSMHNIFETDSPNYNNLLKIHSNTNTNTELNNPNKSSTERKEINNDSTHKRLMSLGSLIEREPGLDQSSPDENEADSQSSNHLSSSSQNDQMGFIQDPETASEGNIDGYISEETPSENENYVDALTTMVESEVESRKFNSDNEETKHDSAETTNPNSHISSEWINKVMNENRPTNKMVPFKKAVSLKVSFEESENKSSRKLVKDSFSHSLRHMAKQILDFKDDLTEEEFDLEETRDEFVINSADQRETVMIEKGRGLDENIPLENEDLIENEMEMEDEENDDKVYVDLIVPRENEMRNSANLETEVMEKLDSGEELRGSVETNEIPESEILETVEMEKLDSGEELGESEETNENQESRIPESNEIETLGPVQELHEDEETHEIQESEILVLNETEKLDSVHELNENEERNEIQESNETEKLDTEQEFHENEEINEIQESQMLESNEIKKLESQEEELQRSEEPNKIQESENLESNEIKMLDSKEKLHESKETNEIQESENLHLIEVEKLKPGEKLQESEETNEIPKSGILESNEIEKLDPGEEFHENEETNEILAESIVTKNLIKEEYFVNDISKPQILDSIEARNLDLSEENTVTKSLIKEEVLLDNKNDLDGKLDFEEHKESNDANVESDEIMMNDNVINENLIMKDEKGLNIERTPDINVDTFPNIEVDLCIEATVDQHELLKEEIEGAETSSPVSHNISSPVCSDPVKKLEVNFEDIFSSYGMSIPLPSISNQKSNCSEIIPEESNKPLPPLPPLPPIQWRSGKPQTGPTVGQMGPVSNFGKLGRPPRPKPSRAFPKMVKNPSDKQLSFQQPETEQVIEKREIINENESLPKKESEKLSEFFGSKPTLEKDVSINGISNNNINEILYVENDKLKVEEFSTNEEPLLTGDDEIAAKLEREEPKKKPPPVPAPPKYPLFHVTYHDKTMLKKAPKLIQPSNRLITPSMLEEIRNRSFSLKPVLIRKPNLMGQYKRTNLKVAAMLEKAHAIRQAVASDESDNDSWSE